MLSVANADCSYAECHYAECHFFILTLSVAASHLLITDWRLHDPVCMVEHVQPCSLGAVTTLGIKVLFVTLRINDIQHKRQSAY
jgi:hypothetical protein